jgi:hypothetical protein
LRAALLGSFLLVMQPAAIERSVVFWFGPEPSAEEVREFNQRGMTVTHIPTRSVELNYGIARGAVFCCKPPHVPEVCQQLTSVETALNHGLMVYLVASDDSTQAHIGDLVTERILHSGCSDAIRRRTGHIAAYEIPEAMARYAVGPASNAELEITMPPDIALTDIHRFLLRRAFGDCTSIALKSLSGGRSALTLSVQATLRASLAGPRPLPFFAKLDTPEKIHAELLCYEQFATLHIPWYLRPNLQPARYVVGTTDSILVGSFVEQSESLWDAVQRGRGSRFIHGLFEDTLLGWRSQAYRTAPAHGNLANALRQVFDHRKARPDHITFAQTWGPVPSAQDLWQQLLNLPPQPHRVAPMHGDMHGENVRVRNNDSIIIDLANTARGPLCADLASLDVWLSFEIPSLDRERPNRSVWTRLMDDLYSPSNVARPPREEGVDTGIEWLRDCIRTIRMIAASIRESAYEYETAIALYLLRRSQYEARGATSDLEAEDAYRRAYAYQLASRLVADLVCHSGVSAG